MTLSSYHEAAHYTKPPTLTIYFCCCRRTLAGGPLTAVLGYFFPAIFLGRADARSREKSGKNNTRVRYISSIVVRERKKGKKGKKEGKKKKKRGGALGRARTTDQLVYPDFPVRMRSY